MGSRRSSIRTRPDSGAGSVNGSQELERINPVDLQQDDDAQSQTMYNLFTGGENGARNCTVIEGPLFPARIAAAFDEVQEGDVEVSEYRLIQVDGEDQTRIVLASALHEQRVSRQPGAYTWGGQPATVIAVGVPYPTSAENSTDEGRPATSAGEFYVEITTESQADQAEPIHTVVNFNALVVTTRDLSESHELIGKFVVGDGTPNMLYQVARVTIKAFETEKAELHSMETGTTTLPLTGIPLTELKPVFEGCAVSATNGNGVPEQYTVATTMVAENSQVYSYTPASRGVSSGGCCGSAGRPTAARFDINVQHQDGQSWKPLSDLTIPYYAPETFAGQDIIRQGTSTTEASLTEGAAPTGLEGLAVPEGLRRTNTNDSLRSIRSNRGQMSDIPSSATPVVGGGAGLEIPEGPSQAPTTD